MLDALCKSPVPYEVNGKTYEVSPLSQGDFADLISTIRWHRYTELLKLPQCPEDIIRQEIERARDKKLFSSTPEVLETLIEDWAIIEMCYLGLRGRQPDITRETVKSWDMFYTRRIQEILFVISEPWCSVDEESKKNNRTIHDKKTPQEVEEYLENASNERLARWREELKNREKGGEPLTPPPPPTPPDQGST